MPILPKEKHEAFAQAVALGLTAAEAARKVGYSVRSSASTGWHLNQNDRIIARIAELKGENRKLSAPLIDRESVIEFLVKFVRLPIRKIDVKPTDQLKAAELLSRMNGWNEPEKHDLIIGLQAELISVIAKMRGKKSVQTLELEASHDPKAFEAETPCDG